MDETADKELIEYFRFKETEFYPDFVTHTITKHGRVKGERDVVTVERWIRSDKIDDGTYGTVYLEHERSGALRAVKVIRKRSQLFEPTHYLRELLALASLTREEKNFVNFHGWFEDQESLFIAMDYYELGNLASCIKTAITEDEARTIVGQIAGGLKLMHDQRFAHRDIKPSNILVKSKGPLWWVKIADFGISKRVLPEASGLYTAFYGDYVAPEVINLVDDSDEDEEDNYTNAVDMWSLGYLAYWLIAGQKPFKDTGELKRYCKSRIGFPQEHLDACRASDGASRFVKSLLTPQPRLRPSAKQALESPWLRPTFKTKFLTPMSRSVPLKPSESLSVTKQDRPLSLDQKPKSLIIQDMASEYGMSTKELLETKVVETLRNDDSIDGFELDAARTVHLNPSSNEGTGTLNAVSTDVASMAASTVATFTNDAKTEKPDSVEAELVRRFKQFAAAEKSKILGERRAERLNDRRLKFDDLRKFSATFQLPTKAPADIVPIMTKDPAKQRLIASQETYTESEIRSRQRASNTRRNAIAVPAYQQKDSESYPGSNQPEGLFPAYSQVTNRPHDMARFNFHPTSIEVEETGRGDSTSSPNNFHSKMQNSLHAQTKSVDFDEHSSAQWGPSKPNSGAFPGGPPSRSPAPHHLGPAEYKSRIERGKEFGSSTVNVSHMPKSQSSDWQEIANPAQIENPEHLAFDYNGQSSIGLSHVERIKAIKWHQMLHDAYSVATPVLPDTNTKIPSNSHTNSQLHNDSSVVGSTGKLSRKQKKKRNAMMRQLQAEQSVSGDQASRSAMLSV